MIIPMFFIGILISLFFSLILYIAIEVYRFGKKDESKKADAIIVLGASAYGDKPSPVLRERINHAILLYENKISDKIIFTGGIGENSDRSEAEVSKIYAVSMGIPERDIILEDTSRSTMENLKNALHISREHGFESFIIVSTPFHMKRAVKMAEDLGMLAYSSPTRSIQWISFYTKSKAYMREVFGYLKYLSGL